MFRRDYLALAAATSVAGCSRVPLVNNSHSIGESAKFSEVVVTVTDVMTVQSMKLHTNDRTEDVQAPDGGKFALFKLEVSNEDITNHEGPAFNIGNYETLKKDPDTLYMRGVNDIRVYGSGEGGHLPETKYGDFLPYHSVTVNGSKLSLYPVSISGTRPEVGANQTLSGWVYGLIKSDSTPELKVQYNEKSAMWKASESA